MEHEEAWAIEGEIAAKSYAAFREAWFEQVPKSERHTGEQLEAMMLTFAERWTAYRRDGA